MVTPLIHLQFNPQVSQLPFILHSNGQSQGIFLQSFVQHSALLHSIPRFSSSAEKRHRDVTIVHVQEACSYNCSFSFGPATIRSPDHQSGREAALCQPFCVDVPTIVRSASAVPAADIVGIPYAEVIAPPYAEVIAPMLGIPTLPWDIRSFCERT